MKSNRLTLESFTDGGRHTYAYDPAGNRLTQASSAGVFTSTYDARNLLSSLAEPGGKTASYAYDPASRRVSMEAYGGNRRAIEMRIGAQLRCTFGG